jgi:hypothetical protein
MDRINKNLNTPITPAPAALFEQAAYLEAFKSIYSKYDAVLASLSRNGLKISGVVESSNTVGSTVTVQVTAGYATLNGEPIRVPAQSLERDVSEVMWLAPDEEAVDSIDYRDRQQNIVPVEIRRTLKLTKGSNFPAENTMVRIDAPTQVELDRILLGNAGKQIGDIWIRNIALSNYDTATGLGEVGTIEEGLAICDGRNGTPDMRGMVAAGFTNTGNTAPLPSGVENSTDIGDTFGKDSHVLTEAEMPEHAHDTRYDDTDATLVGGTVLGRPFSASGQLNTGADSMGSKGGDEAHENRQPTRAVLYVQKVA